MASSWWLVGGCDIKKYFWVIFTKLNAYFLYRLRVGMNESSAMRELKEKIYAHKENLIEEFKKTDVTNSGLYISCNNWIIIGTFLQD